MVDFKMGEPLYVVGVQMDHTTHEIKPVLMCGEYDGQDDFGDVLLKMKNGTFDCQDINSVYRCADDAMNQINKLKKENTPEPELQKPLE